LTLKIICQIAVLDNWLVLSQYTIKLLHIHKQIRLFLSKFNDLIHRKWSLSDILINLISNDIEKVIGEKKTTFLYVKNEIDLLLVLLFNCSKIIANQFDNGCMQNGNLFESLIFKIFKSI
jgi:hypothetical protein